VVHRTERRKKGTGGNHEQKLAAGKDTTGHEPCPKPGKSSPPEFAEENRSTEIKGYVRKKRSTIQKKGGETEGNRAGVHFGRREPRGGPAGQRG